MTPFFLLLTLCMTGAAWAGEPPCSLRTSLLKAYEPEATDKERAAARWAVSALIGCNPATLDAETRDVFYSVVDSEYRADHSQEAARWAKRHPRSDSFDDAIGTHQYDLQRYMEQIVDRRLDLAHKRTILNFGTPKAIAALGKHAKDDVLQNINTPERVLYGYHFRHNPQAAQLAALGYWLDPANTEFSPDDKNYFTALLVGLLDATDGRIASGHQAGLFIAAVDALSHSDNPSVERELEKLARKSKNAEVARRAVKAAEKVRSRQVKK